MKQNISGTNIRRYRLKFEISERELADEMCLLGRETTETQIHGMEEGNYKVYDIDLIVITNILHCTIEELLEEI